MWITLTLMHCWGERKLVQPLWKTVWTLLKKLNLPHDPAIPLLGIYPRETKTLTQKGTCRMVFQRPSLLSPQSAGFPVPDLNTSSLSLLACHQQANWTWTRWKGGTLRDVEMGWQEGISLWRLRGQKARKTNQKPRRYFMHGVCKEGDNCSYSHELSWQSIWCSV